MGDSSSYITEKPAMMATPRMNGDYSIFGEAFSQHAIRTGTTAHTGPILERRTFGAVRDGPLRPMLPRAVRW